MPFPDDLPELGTLASAACGFDVGINKASRKRMVGGGAWWVLPFGMRGPNPCGVRLWPAAELDDSPAVLVVMREQKTLSSRLQHVVPFMLAENASTGAVDNYNKLDATAWEEIGALWKAFGGSGDVSALRKTLDNDEMLKEWKKPGLQCEDREAAPACGLQRHGRRGLRAFRGHQADLGVRQRTFPPRPLRHLEWGAAEEPPGAQSRHLAHGRFAGRTWLAGVGGGGRGVALYDLKTDTRIEADADGRIELNDAKKVAGAFAFSHDSKLVLWPTPFAFSLTLPKLELTFGETMLAQAGNLAERSATALDAPLVAFTFHLDKKVVLVPTKGKK